MPTPAKVGCAVKALAPEPVKETVIPEVKAVVKEEKQMITVGKKAPEFEAKAYYNGDFVNVSLNEYDGQWRVLCFYPGDFTFV